MSGPRATTFGDCVCYVVAGKVTDESLARCPRHGSLEELTRQAIAHVSTFEFQRDRANRAEDRTAALERELAPHRAREAERKRKRGAYWLTPDGREEIHETWPNGDDGNCVRPLLDEVERLEAKLAGAREALKLVIDEGMAAWWHKEDCPEDDTCDCPIMAKVNAALSDETP